MPVVGIELKFNKNQLKKIKKDLGIISKSIENTSLFSRIFSQTREFIHRSILANFNAKKSKGGKDWPPYSTKKPKGGGKNYPQWKNYMFRNNKQVFVSDSLGFAPVNFSATSGNRGKLTGHLISALQDSDAVSIKVSNAGKGFKADYKFQHENLFNRGGVNYAQVFVSKGRDFGFLSRNQEKQAFDIIASEYINYLLSRIGG